MHQGQLIIILRFDEVAADSSRAGRSLRPRVDWAGILLQPECKGTSDGVA